MSERSIWGKVARKVERLVREHILRDRFLLEAARWRRDRGDERLRFSYPLSSESLVWDVGGYRGDFADDIVRRFGARVHLFEPLPEFFRHCVERFSKVPAVRCFPYGLGAKDGEVAFAEAADASKSLGQALPGATTVRLRAGRSVWESLGRPQVDLLKINIEGGEYDLLEDLLDAGAIRSFHHVQVQFHDFADRAVARRDTIRSRLRETHDEEWCYPFIWESWKVR